MERSAGTNSVQMRLLRRLAFHTPSGGLRPPPSPLRGEGERHLSQPSHRRRFEHALGVLERQLHRIAPGGRVVDRHFRDAVGLVERNAERDERVRHADLSAQRQHPLPEASEKLGGSPR